MNDETRKLYAAIGRGEELQIAHVNSPSNWFKWVPGYTLGTEAYHWRIKPREILVNGVRVPAPLEVMPEDGFIFIPNPWAPDKYIAWDVRNGGAHMVIVRSIAHATKEAAIAHAKAMLIRVPV